jgi:hypothetical protein
LFRRGTRSARSQCLAPTGRHHRDDGGASLCGATTATEFALFAENRKAALSRLIDYDSAPSHDTFSRLLRLMDPEAFEGAFAVFAEAFARALAETREARGEVVALDGKALRRAYERGRAARRGATTGAVGPLSEPH